MKNKLFMISGIITVLIVVGIYNLYFKSSNITVSNGTNYNPSAIANNNGNGSDNIIKDSSPMKNTGELFANSLAYRHAFQIFPDQLSSDAKTALDGFDMKTENLDSNSYRITLIAKARDYRNQSIIVNNGQKLYFVETSWGDDGANQDYSYRDDYMVVVDAKGYILK